MCVIFMLDILYENKISSKNIWIFNYIDLKSEMKTFREFLNRFFYEHCLAAIQENNLFINEKMFWKKISIQTATFIDFFLCVCANKIRYLWELQIETTFIFLKVSNDANRNKQIFFHINILMYVHSFRIFFTRNTTKRRYF